MRDLRAAPSTRHQSRRHLPASRLVTVVVAAVAVLAMIVAGAPTAQAHTRSNSTAHGLRSVHVSGILRTTAVAFGPDSVTIVNRSDAISAVRPLGHVTLNQLETVTPATLQTPGPPPVPATGTLTVTKATIASADGRSSLSYTSGEDRFRAVTSVTEASGLHPIAFRGTLTVTGGTGALAGARGTLHYVGGYSFTGNTGWFVVWGTVQVARR